MLGAIFDGGCWSRLLTGGGGGLARFLTGGRFARGGQWGGQDSAGGGPATPLHHVPTEEKCGGQYIYLGITSSVVNILKQNTAFLDNSNSVDLVVSIDGINIFKASPTQLWPIICTFSDFEPFVVALYYGTSKPDSVNDYLADFLAEYTQLQENKIVVNGKEINVQIKALVCDAPARAFVKCIKGHTGYYSCERCIVKGEYKNKSGVLGRLPSKDRCSICQWAL